ncbi:G subunit of V-type ATPase [Pyronema domesticum]|nr:G subunit of V-type ATPase [Pyronema domesticum]
MAAQNSAGIRALLEVEQEAQRIVTAARDRRARELKKARDEAKAQIDEYQREKDLKLKKLIADGEESHQRDQQEAESKIQEDIERIRSIGNEKMDILADELIDAVLKVDPQPHKNAASSAARSA